MTPGLSGYVPVRNGLKLDYCFELAVRSLLPICDEVVVCDSDSTDGTKELVESWMEFEPRIRLINYPWPNPKGDVWMLMKWLNFARKELNFDMQITLDADEVLHPCSYPEIRHAVAEKSCRWFTRFNFWKNAQSLVPEGQVCGRNVVRLGPTELEMVSDNAEEHPGGEPAIRQRATFHPQLLIWHLGFLRNPEAFFAKSKVMQQALLNDYDKKLAEAEKTGQPWYELSNGHIQLDAFEGQHPNIVRPWLKERGYAL
jgi:glycosyltransferase involved in cell wall biosynthesis